MSAHPTPPARPTQDCFARCYCGCGRAIPAGWLYAYGHNPKRQVILFAPVFWSKVVKGESCWLWSGAHSPGGYGQIRHRGKLLRAHHVAYSLCRGPVTPGLWVLHDCPGGDNPGCVNPAHLWLGTHADNTRDMVAKGRQGSCLHPERLARGDRNGARTRPETHVRGESHPQARLTDQAVKEIRRLSSEGHNQCRISRTLSVPRRTVRNVLSGRHWKHVR